MLIQNETLVVPYWIMQAFTRNNLNQVELLKYDSLRKVLSVDDMVQYYCVNAVPESVCPVLYYTAGGLNNISSLGFSTPEQKKELSEVIEPLSRLPDSWTSVYERLSFESESEEYDKDVQYHSMVSLHGGVTILIIKRGFLEACKNRDYALKVISDYLKAQYSQHSIDTVSKLSAYSYYLKLLAESVR